MRRKSRPAKIPESNIILIIVASSALFLGVYFSQQVNRANKPNTVHATLYPNDYRKLTAFQLLDQDANTYTEANLQGFWTLTFFGFTSCPDVCPTTLATLGQVYEQLKAKQPNTPLQVVFITADPERDTPGQLKSYVQYFNPSFIGLSGTPEELNKVAKYFGIFTAKVENSSDPDNYTIDHGAAVILLSPKARPYALFSAPHNAEAISKDLLTITKHYTDT